MSAAFADLVPDARAFFTELGRNNTREWFEANKARHADRIRKPAELVAELFAADLGRLTGMGMAAKVYRIHRDIRFSKDKRPYNEHLHILWSPAGDPAAPGWFFALTPISLSLSAGLISMEADRLHDLRRSIAWEPDRWLGTIARSGGTPSDWGAPPLRRVPAPWKEDHPAADLLRRKTLVLTIALEEEDLADGLLPGLNAAAALAAGFWTLCR
jgi:uncharacterized protein (TIGR02453 family)